MSATTLELLEQRGLKAVKISELHGGEYVSPCPKCGGFDRFHVWPALNPQGCKGGVWFCRECGNSGDANRFIHVFGDPQIGRVVYSEWNFLKSFPVVIPEEASTKELRKIITRLLEYMEAAQAENARLRASLDPQEKLRALMKATRKEMESCTPCPICGAHGHIGDCEGD